MKAKMLYRIASVLMLVFVAGNTFGLVNFRRASESMSNMHFHFGHAGAGHAGFTFAQVMLGFMAFSTWYVLCEAYLAWHLSSIAETTPEAVGALGWVLVAYQVVTVVFSWIFLTGVVAVFSAGVALCLVWAAWLSAGARPAIARG